MPPPDPRNFRSFCQPDPETLAEVAIEDDHWQWEGYQYIPSKGEEALSGGRESWLAPAS